MSHTLADTFRRLLAEHEARAEHVDPVVIDLPPDLDPATRDALIDVARSLSGTPHAPTRATRWPGSTSASAPTAA